MLTIYVVLITGTIIFLPSHVTSTSLLGLETRFVWLSPALQRKRKSHRLQQPEWKKFCEQCFKAIKKLDLNLSVIISHFRKFQQTIYRESTFFPRRDFFAKMSNAVFSFTYSTEGDCSQRRRPLMRYTAHLPRGEECSSV